MYIYIYVYIHKYIPLNTLVTTKQPKNEFLKKR